MKGKGGGKPLHPGVGVKLKTGESVEDLSKGRLFRVLQQHTDRTHPDYKPDGATVSAVSQAAKPRLEAEDAQRAKALAIATAKNAEGAGRFRSQIAAMIEERPGLTGTKLTALIMQAIEMDSGEIAEAKATGRDWDSLKLRFERKNEGGDPYSQSYVLELVRELRPK